MSGEPRRGFFDAPRWMDGDLAGLSSGAFALGGVGTAIACLIAMVLLAARKVSPSTGFLLAVVCGSLSFLLFFLHRRAERFATVKGSDPRMPRDRTVAFTIAREGNWVRQVLEGSATGFAAVHDDHFFVSTRHYHPEWGFMWWCAIVLVRDPRVQVPVFLVLTILEIANTFGKRTARHLWTDIRCVISSGKTLVVEFAAADARKDLVLEITARDREKILPLLRAHAVVEELPEPPKPERPRRAPPPPRPPKPPETAIGERTVETLDRALDGVRRLRP